MGACGNRAAISKARWARSRRPWRRQRPGPSKPGSPHGSGLGVFRWVVERTLAWLHRFRRLALRYERRADVHEAFPTPRLRPHHLALPKEGDLKGTLRSFSQSS